MDTNTILREVRDMDLSPYYYDNDSPIPSSAISICPQYRAAAIAALLPNHNPRAISNALKRDTSLRALLECTDCGRCKDGYR